MFVGSIVLAFNLLSKEVIVALAGLALMGAISANISVAMKENGQRKTALVTFLATASGMQFLGLSSGILAHLYRYDCSLCID